MILLGDENAQAVDTVGGTEAASQSMTAMAHLATGGSAQLICRNNGFGGELRVQRFNLQATEVGELDLRVERG